MIGVFGKCLTKNSINQDYIYIYIYQLIHTTLAPAKLNRRDVNVVSTEISFFELQPCYSCATYVENISNKCHIKKISDTPTCSIELSVLPRV